MVEWNEDIHSIITLGYNVPGTYGNITMQTINSFDIFYVDSYMYTYTLHMLHLS